MQKIIHVRRLAQELRFSIMCHPLLALFLFVSLALFVSLPLTAQASPATDTLFTNYTGAGGKDYNAKRGETLWKQEIANTEGKTLSCTGCHGNDLTQAGEHRKTHKPIKPMAVSANPNRFTKVKNIEKWFNRNCKDTWGRECTAQEKGDILTYLLAQ